MPKKTHLIQTIVVEGAPHTPFPLDMLRYDNAWPSGSDDAANIFASLNHTSDTRVPWNPETNRQRVRLNRAVDEGYREPTYGRWSSFLWTVVEVDGKRVVS